MTSPDDVETRALRIALIDDLVAEQNCVGVDPKRWATFSDRERMRRIAEARAARSTLGHVLALTVGHLRDTSEDRARRRLARGPGVVSVEGGRVVSADERQARDDEPPAGRPRLVVLP